MTSEMRTAFIETGEVRPPRKCELLNSCGSVVECTHPEAFDAVPIVCKADLAADIADALIATDGDEPLQKEWFRAIAGPSWTLTSNRCNLFLGTDGEEDENILFVDFYGSDWTPLRHIKTRRDVRMLCLALSIQLKGATGS